MRDALGASITLGIAPSALQATTPQTAALPAAPDPYALVDPELVPTLKALPKLILNTETLAAVRSSPAAPPLPAPAPQPIDRRIPGPKGAPDIHLVIVDPAPGGKNRPALLHIHGGGYVSGTAAHFTTGLQRIAQSCGCVVVSVEYRLAPETRFPGSLEDNYTALRWLYTNAGDLGVDRKRIAVGGESAGGGHAAALAIAARDRREIPIALQVLIYPMLDDRTGSTRSVPPHIGAFVWTAESNVFGWTSLLGVPAGFCKRPGWFRAGARGKPCWANTGIHRGGIDRSFRGRGYGVRAAPHRCGGAHGTSCCARRVSRIRPTGTNCRRNRSLDRVLDRGAQERAGRLLECKGLTRTDVTVLPVSGAKQIGANRCPTARSVARLVRSPLPSCFGPSV